MGWIRLKPSPGESRRWLQVTLPLPLERCWANLHLIRHKDCDGGKVALPAGVKPTEDPFDSAA